jgi:hypothetical protein
MKKNEKMGIKLDPNEFITVWPPEKPVQKRFVDKLNRFIWSPKNPYRVVSLGPFFIRKTLLTCAGYVAFFALGYAIFWLCWALLTVEGL